MTLPEDLRRFHATAWTELTRAPDTRNAPCRTLALCTTDTNGQPQARYVILRRTDPQFRLLEFHTDIRSRKWTEIASQPMLTVLAYNPGLNLQIRLNALATRYGPENPHTQSTWSTLPPWTRATYCGGPPGDPLAQPDVPEVGQDAPSDAETSVGQDRFGVLLVQVTHLDLYDHTRARNCRALFTYEVDGTIRDAAWIAP